MQRPIHLIPGELVDGRRKKRENEHRQGEDDKKQNAHQLLRQIQFAQPHPEAFHQPSRYPKP